MWIERSCAKRRSAWYSTGRHLGSTTHPALSGLGTTRLHWPPCAKTSKRRLPRTVLGFHLCFRPQRRFASTSSADPLASPEAVSQMWELGILYMQVNSSTTQLLHYTTSGYISVTPVNTELVNKCYLILWRFFQRCLLESQAQPCGAVNSKFLTLGTTVLMCAPSINESRINMILWKSSWTSFFISYCWASVSQVKSWSLSNSHWKLRWWRSRLLWQVAWTKIALNYLVQGLSTLPTTTTFW